MRRLILPLWPLLLLAACKGSDELPDAQQAAVKLEVSFDFKAGCIAVQARDKAAPGNSVNTTVEVLSRDASKRTVVISVFRKNEWGRTLELISTAHEQSCVGPEVARDSRTVTLDSAGVKTVAISLHAEDVDGDGYVPTAGGGTDCADNDAAVSQRTYYRDGDGDGHGAGPTVQGCTAPSQYVALGDDCDDTTTERAPGRTELCDGVDNDCVNGIDNGLTQGSFYLDADHDGAGAGPVVMACVAPTNHVATSNDCDDTDSQRKPGLAETCDDKDNDCDNVVDDGLPVSTYFRDVDGDGFGKASDSLQKCRAPTGYVANSTDCNDDAMAVNPNALEVCNEVDDNCAGGTDEGFNKTWYRDVDGDTFGRQSDMQAGCTQPAGYVAPNGPTFDCNDDDGAVKPGAPELCNDIDDNCVAGVDEDFTSGSTRKGASCGTPCTGIYVCNMAKTATTCNAPTPTNYYTDADADGDGASGATAVPICPGQSIPANSVAELHTDCDDVDKYNKGTGTEVCDQRDNDCDTTPDDGNVCMGAIWKAVVDPAVSARDWNTVAISKASTTGYPVWIAGAGGALARRDSAGGTFTSFDTACGTTAWNAAWVSSDGSVYLAGSGGKLARHDGTTCAEQRTLASGSNATGIIGFDVTLPLMPLLYVVDEGGHLYSWTSGSDAVEVDDNAPVYRDVHGLDTSRLFLAAQEAGGNHSPLMETYTGGANTSNTAIPGPDESSMRSVWMVSSALAYAVGDNSIIVRWNGSNWQAVTPPAVAQYTSVCAPDRTSVYVTDAAGVIRRYTGTAWLPALHISVPAGALKDVASVAPTNIWAVGPSGRVIHFPEMP
ncbi:putative metal-binding motif-containing protein [Pyxidicoccus caerfyrddinensis]|uniref:putative metal-binding motif-containing protein n=1 Tax=Pyxidicoccus caerfyrddinensis TaxID=2709663 RepID=UPI0013DC9C50|nr:putative metal-binding motif-containing protein [Pyxidicoccus caerfyrddinensis]